MVTRKRYFVTFSRIWDGLAVSEGDAVRQALEEMQVTTCDQIEVVEALRQPPEWLRDS